MSILSSNLLFIGMGAVGRTLLEMWHLEKLPLKKTTIICIEPRALPQWIFDLYPSLKQIKKAITPKNLTALITPLLAKKPFIIDVSVDVDCLEIMKLAKEHGCNYINTSVEGWSDHTPQKLKVSKKDLIERSLMDREKDAEKIAGNAKATMLTNQGANPGLISQLALKGLHDYTLVHGDAKAKKLLQAKKWPELAKHLHLQEIHVSEIDTQKALIARKKRHFFNSWSCLGLIAEGLDPVQISNGTNRSADSGGVVDGGMRIYPVRGMDWTCQSVVFDIDEKPKDIVGFLIPHAEAYTLSQFLSTKDYMPSVYYVYQPPGYAIDSLNDMRENGYKPVALKNCHVMELDEVNDEGYDSLGALLLFGERVWWCGTALSVSMAKDLGFKHSGPTTVQVAGSMSAAIKWICKHKSEGFIEPENLDWEHMIAHSRRYLGKLISKEM